MTIVTIHCDLICPEGQCPTQQALSELYRTIELYALRRGLKGMIEERQTWGNRFPPESGNNTDFVFCVYRDYNAVAP